MYKILTYKNTKNGFTIVEIMIVLAIAGLILLLLIEAIPALERSSRNNLRNEDVANMLLAISHYELNNSGNYPNPCGAVSQLPCNDSNSNPQGPFTYTNLNYYDDQDINGASDVVIKSCSIEIPCSTMGLIPGPEDTEVVNFYNYALCDPNSIGNATSLGRAIIA